MQIPEEFRDKRPVKVLQQGQHKGLRKGQHKGQHKMQGIGIETAAGAAQGQADGVGIGVGAAAGAAQGQAEGVGATATSSLEHSQDGRPVGRRGVSLTPAERTAIEVLHRRGMTGEAIGEAIGRAGATVRAYIKQARELLDANLPEYARLHLAAARVAADKGDGRPMEWAMERTAVVEPKVAPASGPGFVVKIGVMLPGIPSGLAVSAGNEAETVDAVQVTSIQSPPV